MYRFILYILLRSILVHSQQHKMDRRKCKMTHTGIEYDGDVSHTESGAKCREWSKIDSKYHIYDELNDNDFPEGNKSLAKNYCRNVKNRFKGPWCYTENPQLNDEICTIPLCDFDAECKYTLIGADYGGGENTSITGRHCLKWSEKTYRIYLNKYSIVTSDRVLLDERFPGQSRKKSSHNCRNPTSDPNGPWCLVLDDFQKKVKYEKEYCDVNVCGSSDCTAGTNRFNDNKDTYTHFIRLESTDNNHFSFSIQLWNVDFENSTFRVAFTAYPLPLSGQKLFDINNGIEILMSRHGFRFVDKTVEKSGCEYIRNMLSGLGKGSFTVDWTDSGKIIEVVFNHSKRCRTTYDTSINNKQGQFLYYSILGDPALWSVPCYSKCREEITIQPYCNYYRKMNRTEADYEIEFVVRSDQTVILELRDSPNSKYPFLRIEILGTFFSTSIKIVQNSSSTPVIFNCGMYSSILSYWSWSDLTLSAVGDRLQLHWVRRLAPKQTICDIEHVAVANAKWFSICSEGTAHWMFDCDLKGVPLLPDNSLPECTFDKKAETYRGTQWTTKSGQPCFPWIYDGLNEVIKNLFFGATNRNEMANYCRNLIGDNDGPFCYVADVKQLPNLAMKKESCNIRSCPISQCRVTGVGTEFDGHVEITRTNRSCNDWSAYNISVENNLNMSLDKNYCRNPNNDLFGPWCFINITNEEMLIDENVTTTEETIPMYKDLCYIRDCTQDDAFTVIVNSEFADTRIYIRPEWITNSFFFYLKSWDPQVQVGIAIKLEFESWGKYFLLEIGTDVVRLSYHTGGLDGRTTVLKKQVSPRLIPTGYWQSFWISLPPSNIEFGYESSTMSLFSWENPPDSEIPVDYCKFVSFSKLGNEYAPVGLNFIVDYCLVHQTRTNFEGTYYPFGFGRSSNKMPSEMVMHFKIENNPFGLISIKFFGENISNFVNLQINGTHVLLYNELKVLLSQTSGKFIGTDYWTGFTISFNETNFKVQKMYSNLALSWHLSNATTFRLRLYYFEITVHGTDDTLISWTSNCDPPLDQGPVIDGGWSEWSDWVCSIRCGGGLGYRTRTCSNPPASFRGKPCLGGNIEDGDCNTFECGCINPVTYMKINATLESKALNKEAKAGENVILKCERSIVNDVTLDSSGSHLQWLKNGYRIGDKLKFDSLIIEESNLKLTKVQEDDSGVYMCVIYPDCLAPNNVTFVPITIVALVVNSDEAHNARETTQYELICKGLILSFVYVDLSQYWELDNDLMIDYTTKPLLEVDIDYTTELDPSYTGVWVCKVRQNKLNLTWTTNKFKLNVIDPPSFWAYLTSEDAPSVLFHGWNYTMVEIFLWAIVILEIIGVSYTAYWYWKTRRELLGET